MEIAADGTVYTFSVETGNGDPTTQYTEIFTYNPDFTPADTFRISERKIWGAHRFGDTLVTYAYHADQINGNDRPYIDL